jgi:hypothetical protein
MQHKKFYKIVHILHIYIQRSQQSQPELYRFLFNISKCYNIESSNTQGSIIYPITSKAKWPVELLLTIFLMINI